MDKTGSVCVAQTSIADKSSGEYECECVCTLMFIAKCALKVFACGCPCDYWRKLVTILPLTILSLAGDQDVKLVTVG